MTRKFSSTSVATTLNAGINNSATSIVVATGTGAALMGGVTLAAGNVDSFGIALDVDTQNEEIVWVTNVSGDTLTVVRAQAGTSAIAHTAGATVKHVFTGNDATFFTTGTATADGAVAKSTVTAKGDLIVGTASGVVARQGVGTDGYVLTSDSTLTNGIKWSAASAGDVTLTGTQTLTNKTLTAPVITDAVIKGTEEDVNVVASAATGTINFDVSTASVWYYTTNATANHTLNFRYSSGATLASNLAVGDAITLVWLNTNGATAYYPNVIQIDGTTVTPKVPATISAGNASAIDAYTFTIIKTAATPTYTVLETQTKFA